MNNNVETISATDVIAVATNNDHPDSTSEAALQGILKHQALLAKLRTAYGTFPGYESEGISAILHEEQSVQPGTVLTRPLSDRLLLTAIPDVVIGGFTVVDFKPPNHKHLERFKLQTILTSVAAAHTFSLSNITAMVFLYRTETAYVSVGAMTNMWNDLIALSRLAHMIRTNRDLLEADKKRAREKSGAWQRSFFDPVPISPHRRDQLHVESIQLRQQFDEILKQFRSQAKHEFQQV